MNIEMQLITEINEMTSDIHKFMANADPAQLEESSRLHWIDFFRGSVCVWSNHKLCSCYGGLLGVI